MPKVDLDALRRDIEAHVKYSDMDMALSPSDQRTVLALVHLCQLSLAFFAQYKHQGSDELREAMRALNGGE